MRSYITAHWCILGLVLVRSVITLSSTEDDNVLACQPRDSWNQLATFNNTHGNKTLLFDFYREYGTKFAHPVSEVERSLFFYRFESILGMRTTSLSLLIKCT